MPCVSKKKLLLMMLVPAFFFLALSGSYAAAPLDGLLKRVCPGAQIAVYIPDISDFKNYSKWSPIYNYLVREDYGGIYLTRRGLEFLEKFESAIKMPAPDIFSLFKNEVVIWAEIDEFSMKGLNIAIMTAPANLEKWLSIFDSVFFKNKEIAVCEKLDAGPCAYSVALSMPDFFRPESKKKIELNFAVAISTDSVIISTGKQYLLKAFEYSSIKATAAGPDNKNGFAEYFGSIGDKAPVAVYADLKKLYAMGLKELEKKMAAPSKDRLSKEKAAGDKDAAGDFESAKGILEELNIGAFDNLKMKYEMFEKEILVTGRLDAKNRDGLLKTMGGEFKFMEETALCPADASSVMVISLNVPEIYNLQEKVIARLPFMARTQYSLGQAAVSGMLGMKIREDVFDIFAGVIVIINKIARAKTGGAWISLPTVVFKLKNQKNAVKIIDKLIENKMLSGFEQKELLGIKYFSQKIPNLENTFLCFAVSNDNLVLSINFDHFSAILRHFSKPSAGITADQKFRDATAAIPEKLLYFAYSKDEDFSEYYYGIQRGGAGLENEKNKDSLFEHYDAKKIDWARLKAHQAPSVMGVTDSAGGYDLFVRSGFKREE